MTSEDWEQNVELILAGKEPTEYLHITMDVDDYLLYEDPDVVGTEYCDY